MIDRKPVSIDSDDEHHIKLMHRQSKNDTNNDASQVIAFIPIGSTVVVQWEGRGLWTHGMTNGKGNHNHHNWSHNIQVTTMGRIITCNRQHIKLTLITAEEYIHYQAKKHTNRQTDPLDAILDHIKNNPQSYSNEITLNKNNDCQDIHGEQGAKKKNPQGNDQEHIQKILNKTRMDNDDIQKGENIIKTRYGRTIRKPDRLTYQ